MKPNWMYTTYSFICYLEYINGIKISTEAWRQSFCWVFGFCFSYWHYNTIFPNSMLKFEVL